MLKKNFGEVFKGANPLGKIFILKHCLNSKLFSLLTAIKLLEEMLELDADKRMTAEKALAHPYLSQYADPTDEPNSPPYDQSFEDMELNVERWKGKLNM